MGSPVVSCASLVLPRLYGGFEKRNAINLRNNLRTLTLVRGKRNGIIQTVSCATNQSL